MSSHTCSASRVCVWNFHFFFFCILLLLWLHVYSGVEVVARRKAASQYHSSSTCHRLDIEPNTTRFFIWSSNISNYKISKSFTLFVLAKNRKKMLRNSGRYGWTISKRQLLKPESNCHVHYISSVSINDNTKSGQHQLWREDNNKTNNYRKLWAKKICICEKFCACEPLHSVYIAGYYYSGDIISIYGGGVLNRTLNVRDAK